MKSPDWIDLYRRTIFQVRDSGGKLTRFTAETQDQFQFLKQKEFAVITAFNPMNQPCGEAENLRQNALLEKDLKEGGYLFYSTAGELNGHCEMSFTVENISEEKAVELGRKYRQHAILYSDMHGVRFPECA